MPAKPRYTATLIVKVEPDLARNLAEVAEQMHTTQSQLVRDAIRHYLNPDKER